MARAKTECKCRSGPFNVGNEIRVLGILRSGRGGGRLHAAAPTSKDQASPGPYYLLAMCRVAPAGSRCKFEAQLAPLLGKTLPPGFPGECRVELGPPPCKPCDKDTLSYSVS